MTKLANRKICRFCSSKKQLHKHSMTKTQTGVCQYYSCRECSRKLARKQYKKDPTRWIAAVAKYQKTEKGLRTLLKYWKKKARQNPKNIQYRCNARYYTNKLKIMNEKNITKG